MVVTTTYRLELEREIMAHLNNQPVCGVLFGNHVLLIYKSFDFRLAFTEFSLTGRHSAWSPVCGSGSIPPPFPPSSGFGEFKQRMFPFVPFSYSVRVADLINVFNKLLHQSSDADAVKYPRQPITDERMAPVSNLDESDMGFHLQTATYVFDKTEENLNPNAPIIGSRHTCTQQGFIYAFKVWIKETFPNSSIVGSL
ncbi:unnamed protein product [Lactuca saligna]|uniref:Uncharacterized protein n=1 Tax=Lactuca saligna TaxID=75948 RepID=A0AA35Z3J4_LACSI|nr:unnamed protein product [Lactuca saligna]